MCGNTLLNFDIHVGKCWKILLGLKNIGKFLYMYDGKYKKISFHVKEHIGSVEKFHRGYLNVLEMFAVSGGKHSLGNSVNPVV
jgi:hypothetical protein